MTSGPAAPSRWSLPFVTQKRLSRFASKTGICAKVSTMICSGFSPDWNVTSRRASFALDAEPHLRPDGARRHDAGVFAEELVLLVVEVVELPVLDGRVEYAPARLEHVRTRHLRGDPLLNGSRSRSRAHRACGPREIQTALLAGRPLQFEETGRELSPFVLLEDLLEVVEKVVREDVVARGGLGVLHLRMKDGDPLERSCVVANAFRGVLGLVDATIRADVEQALE